VVTVKSLPNILPPKIRLLIITRNHTHPKQIPQRTAICGQEELQYSRQPIGMSNRFIITCSGDFRNSFDAFTSGHFCGILKHHGHKKEK
jgi:hypothetical protein